MLTTNDILAKLDKYKHGYYCHFISLGHVYSYLIDCRLNIFKGDMDRWAIVSEKLGFNPRAGGIELEICYFGNCLTNLEITNGQKVNYYSVSPIAWDDFNDTVENDVLKKDAQYWSIRGEKIKLSYDKQEYKKAGIQLKEYEPDEISLEEIGRLLVTKHRDLFRATAPELYKSIPHDLKKIMIIDEWYHRDFDEVSIPALSDQELRTAYELSKESLIDTGYADYENFVYSVKEQEQSTNVYNKNQWQYNRPSSYETWQQLANVIVTGNTTLYRPTLEPNTHWTHWPESGSL